MSLDAMKQSLDALEECTAYTSSESWSPSMTRDCEAAITALRAAIEQAQEPVAWMYHGIRHDDTPHERPSLIWKPEYMDVMSAEKGAKATPLYTAPRQWQGLTQREIDELWDLHHDDYGNALSATGYERAIEAKLRERNA